MQAIPDLTRGALEDLAAEAGWEGCNIFLSFGRDGKLERWSERRENQSPDELKRFSAGLLHRLRRRIPH